MMTARSTTTTTARHDNTTKMAAELNGGGEWCRIHYHEPSLVAPSEPTPRHTLYLSNLDDQRFLRFSIKYLHIYAASVSVEALRASLAMALVEYYPLAGRLRTSSVADPDNNNNTKLEVDCNGEGALFVRASLDLTLQDFMQLLQYSNTGNNWRRKLAYRPPVAAVPPLIIQVTHLRCGGMVLCTSISHCICDGIGSAQFLQAWAQIASDPGADLSGTAVHGRGLLQPRAPPRVAFRHPEFERRPDSSFDLATAHDPLDTVPVSVTFGSHQILQLKKLCSPSLKCTSFEALACHVWRSWAKALDLPPSLQVKLLFSVDVRKKLKPELPTGYYGNGFVLGCAESLVEALTASDNISSYDLSGGVSVVQDAKRRLTNDYVRSMVDLLEERRAARPDLSASLVISQWSRLGLEDLDFGGGTPVHMGPLASEVYCLFLPVVGDRGATTVLVSVPRAVAGGFESRLRSCLRA